jgi:hypothetical protein
MIEPYSLGNRFKSHYPAHGPRQFEVPYVLNNLIDGPALEIGGNNSFI